MTCDEATRLFKREYYKACANESCKDPVAAALFETWLTSVYGYRYDISRFSDDEIDMVVTGRTKSV